MGYHWARFGDPLVYLHAHGVAYKVTGGLDVVLAPKTEWIMHAVDGPTHDLVWGFGILFWFMLGHRDALRRLAVPAQAFAYALVAITLALAYSGSIELYMQGFARYALVAIPVFWAIAAFLETRPAVYIVWMVACLWHYRQVDVCYYVGDVSPNGLKKCNMTQWVDW